MVKIECMIYNFNHKIIQTHCQMSSNSHSSQNNFERKDIVSNEILLNRLMKLKKEGDTVIDEQKYTMFSGIGSDGNIIFDSKKIGYVKITSHYVLRKRTYEHILDDLSESNSKGSKQQKTSNNSSTSSAATSSESTTGGSASSTIQSPTRVEPPTCAEPPSVEEPKNNELSGNNSLGLVDASSSLQSISNENCDK